MTGASKMHADEVETDVSLVRRLFAAQFPGWANLPIEPVLSWGTDNALYRLGQDMVVRLPRIPRTNETLEKEIRWLSRLAPVLPLAIPAVLAVGEPAHGYPFAWAVYSWLEGETATADRIDDRRQAALDLAQFVAALQRVDPRDGPLPGQHNASRGVPLATRDESTRAAIASLSDRIDVAAVSAAWEAALGAPEWQGASVWIHGDLDSRNVLVEQGRLSAVIDWGCLGVGDPACDVTAVWKLLPADTRDIFRAELSVDDATWARARGWALSQALIALSYYTLETNPVLVLEAERWMAEVLADHASTAEPHLAELAELGTLLERGGFESWLIGGWAVDFHVGAVTREHSDIDIAVWARDADALGSLLQEEGWRHEPEPGEDGGTGYTRDGVRVELTYLVRDDAGRILITLRAQNVVWSTEPFGNDLRELRGVRARVIALPVLRAGKSSPRDDPDDAAKDRADFHALSRLAR